MPLTQVNFELFTHSLINRIKECLLENNDTEFLAWLTIEAELDFSKST